MNLYLSHLFEDYEMKYLVDNYQIGIESIEFSIGYCLDEKEKSIQSYKDRMDPYLEKTKLSAHGPFIDLAPFSFDTQIKKASMQRFQDAYDSIKKLNGTYIVYHTCLIPSVYYESSWQSNSIIFWKEFMQDKDNSISVYLENMYDNNPEPIAKVIDDVNHPAFGFCLDIGHVNCFSKRPIDGWIRELGNRIKHFHIHNNNGWRDQHNDILTGTIPIKKYLDIIAEKYPQADWTLEMNKYEDATKSIEWLKENSYI